MTLQELQVEIIENRERRGWESAYNIDKTVLGLVEEYGELTLAREADLLIEKTCPSENGVP